jgi:hypothetical protein
MSHPAEVFTTFKAFMATQINHARARQVWKRHLEKHGKAPMIVKCSVCSGQELKDDIKHGAWKESRPSRAERDELKDY